MKSLIQNLLFENICRAYGLLELDTNSHYIIMQYIPDGSLLDQVRKGHRFDLREKVSICTQLSAGQMHMHLEGVVHADCKSYFVFMFFGVFHNLSSFAEHFGGIGDKYCLYCRFRARTECRKFTETRSFCTEMGKPITV